MANLKIYDGFEWVDIAQAHTHVGYSSTGHTHNPSGGTILSGGSTDGQVMVWRDSIDAWSGETFASGARKDKKIFYIENPIAGNSYPCFSVPVDCTINRITHQTDTGTCTFNLDERTETTVKDFGTNIWSSNASASTTMSASTDFNNSTLDENDWLYFSASTVTGSPTKLWGSVTYTED